MILYILLVKNVEVTMVDNIEKVFPLEQILEIVDVKKQGNNFLGKKNFSKEFFEIDYIQLEVLRKKIGDIGERYVYECERRRLAKANSKYVEYVDATPAQDHRNGYDILSYTEEGQPIYIEVKSTMGDLDTPFYITANEQETAKRIRKAGGIYQIHRVYNIGKEIGTFVYEDESMFVYEEVLYCVSIQKDEQK